MMPGMYSFMTAGKLNGWLNPMSKHPVEYKKQTHRTAATLLLSAAVPS